MVMTQTVTKLLVTLLLILSFGPSVFAQGTIFLVRHAERADTGPGAKPDMAKDPSLSDIGHARATSLATLLKDAGITAIFVTEFKRTQETAAPLAKSRGITPVIVSSSDTAALIARLKQTSGNVLVVGHSNTVPNIVKELGVTSSIAIGDNDFDNLFLIPAGEPVRMIHLHYR
jgi:phosphohistidine phosphatase SixA